MLSSSDHRNSQNGFTGIEVIIGVVVFAIIGGGIWLVMSNGNNKTTSSDNEAPTVTNSPTSTPNNNEQIAASTWPTADDVTWDNTSEGGWLAVYGTPPPCPDPLMFTPPADISKATSILYPGQERRGTFEGQGGNYKPHGGFRFDGLKYNEVQVKAPFDGYVYRGSRFLFEGEIQYTFDIINPCGIMVRLGHLRELSPEYQAIADKFPEPRELDSRTERVQPRVAVKTGDLIATAVGFIKGENTFFDWGVFDLRQQNTASQSTTYQQAHADAKELAFYAVCWFDLVDKSNSDIIKSLPAADPVNGKTSDYCK